MPEDYADVRRELSDRLFNQVTGKSELVKKLFESVLSPYAKRPFGWLWLLLSGRSVSRKRELLRARIDGMLQGRGSERLAGLDQLIGTVVELRALPAQRLLTLVAIHVWQVIGG